MACECGKEEKTELKATGHAWGKWTETKAPTATEAGEEKRICGKCGEEETRSVPALETDTDEPAPDQPQKPVKPDEPEKGSCDRCGTVHTNIFQKLICLLMDLMHRVLNMLTGIFR